MNIQFLVFDDANILEVILRIYMLIVGSVFILYAIKSVYRIVKFNIDNINIRSVIIAICIFLIIKWEYSRISLIWLCTAFYIIFDISFIFYSLLSLIKKAKSLRNKKDIDKNYKPTISIIFPAKNEGRVIAESIKSVLKLDYPEDKREIIVIDDNSTDNTIEVIDQYVKEGKIKLFRNTGSPGKASALNKFIDKVDSEFIMILDADHHLPSNYLEKIIHRFKNPKLGLIQGMHTVRNGVESLIARLVELEFTAFHHVYYYSKSFPVYLGTGAIFRKQALIDAGSFNNDLSTEDTEMSYRIHQKGYKVEYTTDITTYELAVTSFKELMSQRYRWARGTWQSMAIQLGNTLKSNNISFMKKLDFLQFGIGPLVSMGAFFLNICFVFSMFNIISFPYDTTYLIVINVIILLYYVLGVIYSRKFKLAPYSLLIPAFGGFLTLANVKGMIDELLLKNSFKGAKANR